LLIGDDGWKILIFFCLSAAAAAGFFPQNISGGGGSAVRRTPLFVTYNEGLLIKFFAYHPCCCHGRTDETFFWRGNKILFEPYKAFFYPFAFFLPFLSSANNKIITIRKVKAYRDLSVTCLSTIAER
jgi:hypothetical protein